VGSIWGVALRCATAGSCVWSFNGLGKNKKGASLSTDFGLGGADIRHVNQERERVQDTVALNGTPEFNIRPVDCRNLVRNRAGRHCGTKTCCARWHFGGLTGGDNGNYIYTT